MVSEKQGRFETYAAFWPFYLGQHGRHLTRYLHILGTLLALLILIKAIVSFSFLWLLMALAVGYGFAWAAHHFVEHNHPATLTYPLWSLVGDFHMAWLWCSGQLESELLRYHIKD